jgi:hypothetical protein
VIAVVVREHDRVDRCQVEPRLDRSLGVLGFRVQPPHEQIQQSGH